MRRESIHRTACRIAAVVVAAVSMSASAYAQAAGCASLPKYAELKAALAAATSAETSGLNNQMWGTIVDRDGTVCAVAFTGKSPRFAMARKPRHRRAEGQYRERLRPGFGFQQRRLRPSQGARAFHRQSV